MDRDRARANIKMGMLVATIALCFFGLSFYVAILYLA